MIFFIVIILMLRITKHYQINHNNVRRFGLDLFCVLVHFLVFLLAAAPAHFSSFAMTWSAKTLKGRDLLP